MKLAIASQNKKQVTGHAGQCRNYWVFDFSGSKAVGRTMVRLERNQTFHETGGSMVPALEGIDVLISGGMGSALVRRLAERSFSWSGLLEKLSQTMPRGVRLMRLSPEGFVRERGKSSNCLLYTSPSPRD